MPSLHIADGMKMRWACKMFERELSNLQWMKEVNAYTHILFDWPNSSVPLCSVYDPSINNYVQSWRVNEQRQGDRLSDIWSPMNAAKILITSMNFNS